MMKHKYCMLHFFTEEKTRLQSAPSDWIKEARSRNSDSFLDSLPPCLAVEQLNVEDVFHISAAGLKLWNRFDRIGYFRTINGHVSAPATHTLITQQEKAGNSSFLLLQSAHTSYSYSTARSTHLMLSTHIDPSQFIQTFPSLRFPLRSAPNNK